MQIRTIIRAIISIALTCVMVSCVGLITEDPADKYVGTYTYAETYYATWGSASKSFSHNGTFTITKQSSDRVKISNPWNTGATAMPTILSIDPVTQSDNTGYVNYTFISAMMVDNTLTISYQGVGSMKNTDGKSYPYSCQGTITARKNN